MMATKLEEEKASILYIHSKTRISESTDVEEEMSFISDETFFIPPNGSPIVGLSEVRRLIEETIESKTKPVGNLKKGTPHLWLSSLGDMAIIRGIYKIVRDENDRQVEEKGHYITIYRKLNGKWKLLGEMWNSLT